MTQFSERINPLAMEGLEAEALQVAALNTINNILQSYNGRHDAFVEMVQNAVDALQQRWETETVSFDPSSDPDTRPFIRIVVDCNKDELTVIDNGIGVDGYKFAEVLAPNLSPKSLVSPGRLRGHKGVGTTFLMYGHDIFRFESKHVVADGSVTHVGYELDGARTSVRDSLLPLPELNLMAGGALSADLSSLKSGSSVTVQLDADSSYGRLSGTIQNSLNLWVHILRTMTALGEARYGSKVDVDEWHDWERALRAEVHLVRGVSTSVVVPFSFDRPHISAADLGRQQVASLDELPPGKPPVRSKELIYLSYDHASVRRLFKNELQELKDSASDSNLATSILARFEVLKPELYACLSYENTYYDKLVRERIGNADARNLPFSPIINGGTSVTSNGMPMAVFMPHQSATMQPQIRRRLFVQVGLNGEFRPDIGRKSIPASDLPLVGWLEELARKRLQEVQGWLIKANDDSPHKGSTVQQAKEALQKKADEILGLTHGSEELVTLPIPRRPRWEEEVIANFVALVCDGRLQGYTLHGLPGTSASLDFLVSLKLGDTGRDGKHGISSARFSDGEYRLTKKWGEFKVELRDLLEDFQRPDGDPSKKYFGLVDVAVVWLAKAESYAGFDVTDLDASNTASRNFFGATHQVTREGSDHAMDVICLKDFVGQTNV